jgi:hypothetical protein
VAEYLHGSACHYCGKVLTVRVNIEDVRDAAGTLIDVSVETDMAPWWEHITAHREARMADSEHITCDEAIANAARVLRNAELETNHTLMERLDHLADSWINIARLASERERV